VSIERRWRKTPLGFLLLAMRLNRIILAVVLGLLFFPVSTVLAAKTAYRPEPASVSVLPATVDIMEERPYPEMPANNAADDGTWHTVQVFSGKGNTITPPFRVSGTKWGLRWSTEPEVIPDAGLRVHIFQQDKPYALWQIVPGAYSPEGKATFPISTEEGERFFLKVFAHNLKSWTIIVQDDSIAISRPIVEISYIHYKGEVYPRNTEDCICYEVVEPDEYVVITNSGERPQRMDGWTLKNITKGYPTFTFPMDFVLNPGQSVIITTDKVYPDCGSWLEFGTNAPYCTKQLWFSFFFGPGDIWTNNVPDIAVLYDASGKEVSRKSYAITGQ